MPSKILLFVPAHNCERQLPRVVERLRRSPALPFLSEVLVVNDGSRDGTLAAALACEPLPGVTWKVASTGENLGLGGVHKAAFARALRGGFTHAAVLHGDDQADPDDIAPLLATGIHERHSALLGSRFAPGARLGGYSRFRTLGNLAFNAAFSLALRRRVLDLGSGLNVFGRGVMESPHLAGMADGLTFNVHLLVDMLRTSGPTPLFFPLSWREEDQLSNVRLVRQTVATTRILLAAAAAPDAFLRGDHRVVRRASYDLVDERVAEAVAGRP